MDLNAYRTLKFLNKGLKMDDKRPQKLRAFDKPALRKH